jgi:hypothetical protein
MKKGGSRSSVLQTGVARFFLVQTYQNGKYVYNKLPQTIPNGHKLGIPNGHKIFQMVIKYTNIYHSKVLQNSPKFGIFGLKANNLATLGHLQIRMEYFFGFLEFSDPIFDLKRRQAQTRVCETHRNLSRY